MLLRSVAFAAGLVTCQALAFAQEAAAPPALVAQEATDPNGWRAAVWGMTEGEVLAAFPGEVVKARKPETYRDSRVATLEIPRYEVSGTTYRVLFGFDGLGYLASVSLFPFDSIAPGVAHEAAFNALEGLLIEKYGKPITTKDTTPSRTSVSRERTWRLPRTVITLTYFKAAGFGTVKGFDMLLLNYAPPDKEAEKL